MILAGVVAEEKTGGVVWGYYKALTVDHTKCGSSDSSNFPVLVSFTDANLKTVANGGHVNNANGYDIGFSSDTAGATALPFELVAYDGSTGLVEFWVGLGTLSSSVDTVFYVQYGSAFTTDHSSRFRVWNANGFVSVQHFQNGLTDSAGAIASPSTSGSTSYVPGQISEGIELAGGYVDNGYNVDFAPADLTVSFWVNPSAITDAYAGLAAFQNTTDGFFIGLKSNGKMAVYLDKSGASTDYDGSGSATLTTSTWYHAVITYDGTTLKGYVDGVVDASATGTNYQAPSAGATFLIGNDPVNSGRVFAGVFDEVRIASITRGADWVTAEYNNQSAPGTFMSVGSEIAH